MVGASLVPELGVTRPPAEAPDPIHPGARLRFPPMPTAYTFIPMSDGIRLAATLYLPGSEGAWPAILEALPYRR